MPTERDHEDEQHLVRLYLTDIEQFPVLTSEGEAELVDHIERGRAASLELDAGGELPAQRRRELTGLAAFGKDAQRKLVQSSLRMVVPIAEAHPTGGPIKLLDLIQEGNLGLLRAVDSVGEAAGVPFSALAETSIREAIAGR